MGALVCDENLVRTESEAFARQETKEGMFHLAVNNEFKRCGGCKFFMKDDQRRQSGVKTSRCFLLHKHNGPKARKHQRRIEEYFYGCKHWESGEFIDGPIDAPEWVQGGLFT